jgi:DNA (cytosine-5)-methyltransferase 1
LSLAGAKAGLDGARSGAFWGFRNLMASLAREGRAPRILALENVVGALTSRGGRDFAALCAALAEIGYRCGAMVIDAADFTPQSRPRLFVIAVRADAVLPEAVAGREPDPQLASGALLRAHALLEGQAARGWVWWRLPPPASRNNDLASITEEQPGDVHWRSEAETQRLLSLMADNHRAKVEEARRAGALRVGAVYRRTRATPGGGKAQRAEVRFDGLAGCLRTPGGGSSRQFLLFVEGDRVRSRLLSGREAARLMGLPDDYRLPRSYTDAYHLLGDGVAPPVVRHLAAHLFEPLLDQGWPDRARDAA